MDPFLTINVQLVSVHFSYPPPTRQPLLFFSISQQPPPSLLATLPTCPSTFLTTPPSATFVFNVSTYISNITWPLTIAKTPAQYQIVFLAQLPTLVLVVRLVTSLIVYFGVRLALAIVLVAAMFSPATNAVMVTTTTLL